MEKKIDIKAKTIKVDTGKGNAIKVTMSYGEQSNSGRVVDSISGTGNSRRQCSIIAAT